MKPLFVSYYTKEGDYNLYANNLRQSLISFNLEHEIEEVSSHGHWNKNNAIKPTFILKKMLDHHRPIIWLDCDCEIKQEPKLLIETGIWNADGRYVYDVVNYDLAIYRWIFKDNKEVKNIEEINEINNIDDYHSMFSGGVIGLDYNVKTLELLIKWVSECNENPLKREDQILDRIYQENKSHLKLNGLWLPKSYNRMNSHWPDVEPVIDHYYTNGGIFVGAQRFKGKLK